MPLLAAITVRLRMAAVESLEQLSSYVGREIGTSEWLLVTQEQVNRFADTVMDPDWMHIDEARARTGPIGQTIVQGFFTLSLLTHFNHQIRLVPADISYAFNYGLDRVRWLAPLKVGKRIRNRMVLESVAARGANRFLVKTVNTVEIEGESVPAMVAEWLGLVQGPEATMAGAAEP
jgi:acyl dehydratase